MALKGELRYLVTRYCGFCGEFREVVEGQIFCPEPNCNNKLRTRPKSKKNKEKYKFSKRY